MKILHLSDIHFGRDYPKYGESGKFDDKDRILKELIDCISRMEEKPEHIIVTGDIAWWGKKNDFDEANIWFKSLLEKLSLNGNDITFCPGNHDVNRAYGYYKCDITKDTSVEEIDKLYDYTYIHRIEEPLYNYNEFCAQIGMIPFHYPKNKCLEASYGIGYKDIDLKDGSRFRIVSFNTALLSYLSEYPDDANFIGIRQIYDLLKYKILNDKKIYTIAIFHHAERFLHKNEICEYGGREASLPKLREYVDLILCGHTETGGKPVLYKQKDGAYMLTGGAAYYDDYHPNAYSVIEIENAKSEPKIHPYTYEKGKWKQYESLESKQKVIQMENVPYIGLIRGRGRFEINSGSQKYSMDINNLKVYDEENNQCRLNNFDDPTRLIDIVAYAPTNSPGKAKFNVEQTNIKEYSVRSRLEIQKLFSFIDAASKSEEKANFKMSSIDGVTFFSGENICCDIECEKEWINLWEKLKRIEDFYDIRIKCPNECYENDLKLVDTILGIMDNKIVNMARLNNIKVSFNNTEIIKKILKILRVNKRIYLQNSNIYECNLFGKNFPLGKLKVLSGPYDVKIIDLFYKLLTFKDGDNRNIVFEACKDTKTYLMNDEIDCLPVLNINNPIASINNMEVSWKDIVAKKKE